MGSNVRPRKTPAPQGAGDGVAAETDRDRADAASGGSIGPLAGMVGYRLRRAQLAVFDDIIRRFASIDLKPAQFSVLLVLDHTPGLSQSDVAHALGIQRANFVGLIDRLEARGLAVREPAPNDRRSHALFLTTRGRALLAIARDLQIEHEAWAIAALGRAGHGELLRLLERLIPAER